MLPRPQLTLASDVLGPQMVNSMLLADELAGHGFRVLAPDITKGDWLAPSALKAVIPLKSDPAPSEEAKKATFAQMGPWRERSA